MTQLTAATAKKHVYDLAFEKARCSKNIAIFLDKIGLLKSHFIRNLLHIETDSLERKIYTFIHKHKIDNPELIQNEFHRLRKRWDFKYKPMHVPEFNNIHKKLEDIIAKVPTFFSNVNSVENPRTLAMKEHLAKILPGETHLELNGEKYEFITADILDFTTKKLVSAGSSSSREFILFDPNSPILKAYFKIFIDSCGNNLSQKEIIEKLQNFMSAVFFKSSEAKVNQFVQKANNDLRFSKVKGQACIPLEDFIINKLGVCRHHALLGAYLLNRLQKEYPEKCAFKAKVHIMRDDVPGGGHAWLSLICKDGSVWSIDTLNKINLEISNSARLAKFYGEKAVKHQIIKAKKVLAQGI